MTKLRSIIFIATLFISLLCSCAKEPHLFTIGVSCCSTDAWRETMLQEMMQEVSFYNDISLQFEIAQGSDSIQIQHLERFIDEQVDMIIVIPSRSEFIADVVDRAYDSGIDVVVIDNKRDLEKYTAFLGVDNYEIGYCAGEYIASITQRRGEVIELSGRPYTEVAQGRHDGFRSAIDKYEDLKIVCSVDALWRGRSAQSITDSLLRIYPNTKAIFAHNDVMAYGAYKATKELAMSHRIKIIGVDALAGDGNGIDLVSKGILDASFLCPTFGNIVMQRAHQILHNQPFQRETRFETAMINGVNAQIELLKIEQLRDLDRRIETLNNDLSSRERTNESQRYLLIIVSIGIIIAIVVATIIARMVVAKSRLNERLALQNSEISQQKQALEQQRDRLIELTKNLEEATSAKLLFFTNISHDLRTPLTLVADPINYLINSPETTTEERRTMLDIAARNVSILLRLIEQILDFRRYEQGKIELNITQCNFSQSIRNWSSNFNATLDLSKRAVKLYIDESAEFNLMIDCDKIERVYFNLLSNAIKYSLDDTTIEVRISTTDENVSLQIKNRTRELTPKNIDNLFERFYQVDSATKGAGIGLAIAKYYVELHGGKIAASYDSGYLTISIELPHCQLSPRNEVVEREVLTIEQKSYKQESIVNLDESKDVVLIVDDNHDIRQYLQMLLSPHYIVIEAADGEEGLIEAERVIPDLIISDVMMDGMDGVELCKQIKSRVMTCHIPLLMLTACAADEQRIEGYASGADGYLSKPFNFNILLARVNNLITNRKIIKRNLQSPELQIRDDAMPVEQKFIEDLRLYILSNLDNSELNIDDLSAEMGYSRSQLHRKVKALTGIAPIKLIRNLRLERAVELLKTSEKNISEVAYDVGFSSPSYFTKCYKEFFGVAPTSTK